MLREDGKIVGARPLGNIEELKVVSSKSVDLPIPEIHPVRVTAEGAVALYR